MNKIIEVKALEKSYSNIKAVKNISFYINEGSLFAFLGVNGAGKSTTINMLVTALMPDGGEVTINGNKLGEKDSSIRNDIGIVFQDNLLDKNLTVKENLYSRGSLYGMSKSELRAAVEKVIEILDIESIKKQKYGKLSGGQRRRTDIARALIHTPKILFLDEPTTGLDPKTRKKVWQIIKELQKSMGMTVFLTTHYMEEANEADYITVIDDGEIKANGTPTQLKEKYCKNTLRIKAFNGIKIEEYFKRKDIEFTIEDSTYIIVLSQGKHALTILNENEENINNYEVINGTLDDVFINITKKVGALDD